MAFSGMTVSVINELASSLANQSAELSSIKSRVNQLVSEASQVWEGTDLNSFRGQWYSSSQAKMQRAVNQLDSMVTELRRQANDQIQTSGDSPGKGMGAKLFTTPGGAGLGGLMSGVKTVLKVAQLAKVLRSGYTVGWVNRWISLNQTARRLAPIATHETFSTVYNSVVAKGSGFVLKLGDLKPFAQYSGKIATAAKIVGTAGRALGGVLGGVSVVTGTLQAIYGNGHQGWVDVGDRVSGGLAALGGGASVALAIGGAALMATPVGPVIVGVAIGATLVSAAWDFAQWCNDGGLKSAGESLKNWSQGMMNSDRGGFLGSLERGTGSALNGIGSGLTKVGSWLKGLW